MKKIQLLLLVCLGLSQLRCSKDDQNVAYAPLKPFTPSAVTAYSIGFWMEDPYWSGDELTYYANGYVNVSIDNGAVYTITYGLSPAGPSSCNHPGVLKVPAAAGSHTWQVFNKTTGLLIRSGVVMVIGNCELVKVNLNKT